MMRELATLCMSDTVRLLGTLILLSLGITLALWGLKRRRAGAVVMALFLCLVALVPVALAIELPPAGSVAFIQTTGPNGPLANGDWYTSRNPSAGGPGYHALEIIITTTIPPTQMITVELFDPESFDTGVLPEDDGDEIRPDAAPVPDSTTFTLTNPSGGLVYATTYPPDPTTSLTWNTFITFYPGTHGYGTYTLTTTTSDNDENAWKLRVSPDDLDNEEGTGDEILLGMLQTTFQHSAPNCQTFEFFVQDGTDSKRLLNFDLDNNGTITYTAPSGRVFDGTVSAYTVWNNSDLPTKPPPDGPGGDEITGEDLEPGKWQAKICVGIQNQYIFDPGVPFFYDDVLKLPDMIVSKDDGTETYYPNCMLDYTITYANVGEGAALDAVLIDTLPLYTSFVSCGDLSCGYIPPRTVTFSLGTVAAGASGSVWLRVCVDPEAPTGYLTNTVELDHTDILSNDYPVKRDTDVDQYGGEQIITRTPTPTPTPKNGTPIIPTDTPTPWLPTDTPTPWLPTDTPTPWLPTDTPTPTPTDGLIVERLPETGGFPDWLIVVLAIPAIIGVARLLNLALSEKRGRGGDGKGG